MAEPKLNYKTVSDMIFKSMLSVEKDETSFTKAVVLVKQATVINNINRAKLLAVSKTSKDKKVEFYED